MCGKGFWVRSRYRLTVTLKSSQIQTCPFGFWTGTIEVVMNTTALTFNMMLNPSSLFNSSLIFDLRAYGTGLCLKSLYWASGLSCRCALKPWIEGRLVLSKKSFNSRIRISRFENVKCATWSFDTWGVAWCAVSKLNSAIHSRPISRGVPSVNEDHA